MMRQCRGDFRHTVEDEPMTMQFPAPLPVAEKVGPHAIAPAAAGVLLAGFSADEAADLLLELALAGLAPLALPVHEALSEILESPAENYHSFVLDAAAFVDDEALADALRLLSVKPDRLGVVVVNHPGPRRLMLGDRHRDSLELVLGRIARPGCRRALIAHCAKRARTCTDPCPITLA
jgi:hypothetical protein